jgi:hypothetical protein
MMYQLAKTNHWFPTEWSHVFNKKENETVKKYKKGKRGCGGGGGWELGRWARAAPVWRRMVGAK